MAAALKLNRKDRGLLSALIAQVEDVVSISDACKALALSRRDFYRTIKLIRMNMDKDSGGGSRGAEDQLLRSLSKP